MNTHNGSASATVSWPVHEACNLAWFCLKAEGRHEHLAAVNLARRVQVESFAPRIRVRRARRGGGVDMITEALFPGYLFARFHYPAQVRHVVSTAGVLGLVTFGGTPPHVEEETIAQLRRHASPGSPAAFSPVFEEGEWVRVAGGCFRGTEGQVRQFESGKTRACVLLQLLGRCVEISLPADQLVSRSDPLDGRNVPSALRADANTQPGGGP